MTNRAAIRWVTKGIHEPPVIQYMLLNKKLEYILYPKECIVTNLKKNIKDILDELELFSNGDLEVYYKSINKNYGKHRKDSGLFHYWIKKHLAKRNLLQPNSRLAFLLKKDQLRLFKDALFLLDVDCKERGQAFITHLWAIALKATRSRVPLVIKQIWKARFSITRMNQTYEKQFQEFYAHIR